MLLPPGDHGNYLLLAPPPTECGRLLEITDNFCYYPPPPTESGRLQTICVRHSGKTRFDPPNGCWPVRRCSHSHSYIHSHSHTVYLPIKIGIILQDESHFLTREGLHSFLNQDLTRFNKIAIQGTPQMAVD